MAGRLIWVKDLPGSIPGFPTIITSVCGYDLRAYTRFERSIEYLYKRITISKV